ncbi:choline/ethanolamine kinase, putative [Theileria equi strain WA]|uniref:Choline/ethanolamine kinase, putative n=1 Tax=Theileria equi strain WA TaxID=1537102 RepID=L1LA01_THEEQ|nr:choline/ethanolamine kinase, putative [Theileria equi strain WA]EKX72079.1 choline/ethanolamine kinase, putative [Theileria equi strain WA]|eukprot:XP_004831531.1 choline/ethanolamine kinase, putative [Theileria equi strain WA]
MVSECLSPNTLMSNATAASSYMVRVDDSDELKDICIKYVPFWNKFGHGDLQVHKITSAMTNRVYKVQVIEPRKDSLGAHKVLLRLVYPDELVSFDLDHQNEVLELLSSYEFSPRLVAAFPGGRIEQWLDGYILCTGSLQNISLLTSIATILGNFHRIVSMVAKESWSRRPIVERTVERWLPHVKVAVQQRGLDVDVDKLYRAFDIYQKVIAKHAETSQSFSNKVVFCHNDLHLKNIVATYTGLHFIDFDYAGFNYAGYDVANFFAEMLFCHVDQPPSFKIDESLELSKDLKVLFASVYLSAATGSNVLPSDSETIDGFLKSVEIHTLGPMLFWSLWGILLAARPDADSDDFDYLAYSKVKFSLFEKVLEESGLGYAL